MGIFLVTPTHRNGYKAPSFLVEVSSSTNQKKEIEPKSRAKSGLGKFKKMEF